MESDGHKISFGFGVLQAEADRLEAEQAIQKEAELEQSQTELVLPYFLQRLYNDVGAWPPAGWYEQERQHPLL